MVLSVLVLLQTTTPQVAEPVVRTLKISGFFQTQGSVSIKRMVEPTGEIEISESTAWTDKSTILRVRRYTKAGDLISWDEQTDNSTTKGPSKKSHWSAKSEGGSVRLTSDLLNNQVVNGTSLVKIPSEASGDQSLLWWNGIEPKPGTVINYLQFNLVYFGKGHFEPVKITYWNDVSIKVKGIPTLCHRVTTESKDFNTTRWLDQQGMPVKIAYYFRKDETDTYRDDVLE